MRKFLLFAALIVSFIALGRMFDFDPASSRAFLAQHSPLLSSFIFLVLYVVGTFFIWVGPKDVLRVASALVFGAMWSSILVYIGEMLNMVTMFWFSRKMGRAFIEQKMHGRMQQIDEAVSNTRTATIFFMKFYPYVSFRVLDLGYGLSSISFRKYAIISLVAAPIRVYMVQYFLSLGLGTALNFVALQEYLRDRPVVMWANMIYIYSSFIFLGILIARRKKRRTGNG